ncbi:MAG: hypothetical protein IJF92_01750 [Bacilli bacterium]|nr:hypothetical protein [Bacilli bacterium]
MYCELIIAVISGVLVYVFSQLIYVEIIIPIKEFKSIKSRIIIALKFYAPYYNKPYDFDKKDEFVDIIKYKNASDDFRKLSSELSGYIGNISAFRKKKIEKLADVSRYLIGISNGLFGDNDDKKHNIEYKQKLIKKLRIERSFNK